MTLSNCDSLDNLFQDPPEEEESSKFVEAVRTLMNRNDMGYPPAAANGTYCLKKIKSLNAKQWKINKKRMCMLPAVKKKNFDFHEQRSLILNLNLWKFIKFINCSSKNNYNKNNKHVRSSNNTVKNENVLPLQKHKKVDNDQRLENLFWRSWFKARKRRDIMGKPRERHIKFNDNVEQCIITDEHFIQRLPSTRLNSADEQRPCSKSELDPCIGNAASKRSFYDYSSVYVASDAIITTAAATAIISSNSGDYQRGHDVRDVPRNVLLQAGETDFSSMLRVDSDLKLSNISHHSPLKPSSTSSHSTFIFESETDTDTDTDTDAETENDIDAYIDTSIPNLLL